jgi:hypothetical protein
LFDPDESSSFGENDESSSSSSLHVRVMPGILPRLAVINVVMIFLFLIIIVSVFAVWFAFVRSF